MNPQTGEQGGPKGKILHSFVYLLFIIEKNKKNIHQYFFISLYKYLFIFLKGPEPTRYGDWERKGRVSDF